MVVGYCAQWKKSVTLSAAQCQKAADITDKRLNWGAFGSGARRHPRQQVALIAAPLLSDVAGFGPFSRGVCPAAPPGSTSGPRH